jgi:hypothetical protein
MRRLLWLLWLLPLGGCSGTATAPRTCAQIDSAFAVWQQQHPSLQAARPVCP